MTKAGAHLPHRWLRRADNKAQSSDVCVCVCMGGLSLCEAPCLENADTGLPSCCQQLNLRRGRQRDGEREEVQRLSGFLRVGGRDLRPDLTDLLFPSDVPLLCGILILYYITVHPPEGLRCCTPLIRCPAVHTTPNRDETESTNMQHVSLVDSHSQRPSLHISVIVVVSLTALKKHNIKCP